jgi:hypothetical protein
MNYSSSGVEPSNSVQFFIYEYLHDISNASYKARAKEQTKHTRKQKAKRGNVLSFRQQPLNCAITPTMT